MVLRVDLSSNASVKLICVNEENTACAYLANLYIPIFSLDTGKIIRRYEVSNQIVGIQFSHNKQNVFYAVDDSFGMHVFDIRADSKKKYRLNPDVENHNVVCTALSSNNVLAVSSSQFGGGILDVRGSRHREHHPHVISLFDIRSPGEPITTYNRRHKHEVTSMEFYKNGHHLITGDTSGAVKSFDCQLRDEDNAIRWERWAKGPISKVGMINKRIVYSISNRSEASVFVDNKGQLEVLYGSVNNSADEPVVKTSKAFYKKPEWCVGLIKGVNDEIPLVAVHGVDNKKFISLTAMNQEGVRQEKPMLSYKGHVGEVKCMTVTPELLLTGGEDGKVLIQIANFKNSKFGDDNIDHYRLTLNRGNLAALQDSGKAKDDVVSDKSDSEDDSGPGPSSSTASSSSSKPKKDKKSSSSSSSAGPSTSSEGPSSSGSAKKETKEERKERKEREAKEKERAEKKARKEKEAAKQSESGKEEKKEKRKETEEERAERKRKEKKEKERQERKEQERQERKKKHDGEGSSGTASKKPHH